MRSATPPLSASKPRAQASTPLATPRNRAAQSSTANGAVAHRRAAADWPDHVLLIWFRLAIRQASYRLECWWTANFVGKKYSLPVVNLALSGALLLVFAQGPGFTADWEHTTRSVLGFSGLLLLDVSVGLAGYLFLNERWARLGKPPAAHFLWSRYKRLYALLRDTAAS